MNYVYETRPWSVDSNPVPWNLHSPKCTKAKIESFDQDIMNELYHDSVRLVGDFLVDASVAAAAFGTPRQPQAFPLQGSKRLQVPLISNLVPAGKPRLIEPFCGSAAVSVGLKMEGLVSNPVISDVNIGITSLWQMIINDHESLADKYRSVWNRQVDGSWSGNPREFFVHIRDIYNKNPKEAHPAYFLFLLNRIVKGSLRYSQSGNMNQSCDNRRLGAKPSIVASRLKKVSEVLHEASVVHCDWAESIADANRSDLIYLDPPYQGTSNTKDTRYVAGMGVEVFEKGIGDLLDKDLSAIISYDSLLPEDGYGRRLDESLGLLSISVAVGRSSQASLLGKNFSSHETLYLTPALVERLGGRSSVLRLLEPKNR